MEAAVLGSESMENSGQIVVKRGQHSAMPPLGFKSMEKTGKIMVDG